MKTFTLTLLLTFLSFTPSLAQSVSTFTDGTPDDAIALDSNGNIYCSNYVGDTVFKFSPSGEVSSFVTGLNTPNGLAFNSNDELYICDGVANMIYKYDIDGNLLDSYSTVAHPSGIVKSPNSETMIFTHYQGGLISSLDPGGTITEISSAPELNGPVGLAFDDTGVLFVGNYTNREIYKILSNGDAEYIAQVPTDGGPMPNLGFIAFAQGMLWGTTMGSDKIYAINPYAVDDVSLFAGSSQGSMDGDISVATFNTPNGIIFNETGDTMYITDFGTKNLRIISGVLNVEAVSLKKNDVRLIPNPTSNVLQIETSKIQGGQYTIKIFDLLGRSMYDSKVSTNNEILSEAIDVRSWASGSYFVTIMSQGTAVTKKFIKN